ncbi:Ig-like domain-containing protein, partial [Roseibium sp. SCP14]|uniref:Ig-like domain-containing protein n=1 Tax=Roseibium sp. SCP14 TaxID=3141375 RepID=UPI003336F899
GLSVSIDNNDRITVGAHLDDDNGSSSGSVYVFEQRPDGTYAGPDGTVYGTTNTPNLAPEALNLTGSALENSTSVTWFADYVDANVADSHFISIDTTGTLGSVTNNGDGTFSYDPNGQFEYLAAGEIATDTFSYTVTDQWGASSSASGTITITGQNDAPVAVAVSAVASEDGPAVTVTANYSDVDASDSHTFNVDTTGTLGSVTHNGDGTFSYDPNGAFGYLSVGEIATDTFTYTVDDGNGGTSTETVTIRIT